METVDTILMQAEQIQKQQRSSFSFQKMKMKTNHFFFFLWLEYFKLNWITISFRKLWVKN